MNSDDPDKLPPDVQAILQVERAHLAAPAAGRARLAERLSTSVPGFGPAHIPAAASAPPPAMTAAVTKILVVLAIGGGAAAVLRAAQDAAPTVRPARPALIRTPSLERAARVLRAPRLPDVWTEPARPSASPPPAAPPLTPLASLREEQRLLDAARDAIVRGEPASALAPTAAHAARFPRGVLAEERDALQIRALARLGRGDEARALLARMRAAHPDSFLLDGAAADVASIP
jgi:hypothetical protein